MDIVKYGRTKVKVGDCVSVPSSYFGAEYQREIHKALASKCSRIYGRVTCVRDGNRHFDVTWDVDGEVTRAMCLDNVNYEPHDTPPQKVDTSTSVTTSLWRTLRSWPALSSSAPPQKQPKNMHFCMKTL